MTQDYWENLYHLVSTDSVRFLPLLSLNTSIEIDFIQVLGLKSATGYKAKVKVNAKALGGKAKAKAKAGAARPRPRLRTWSSRPMPRPKF